MTDADNTTNLKDQLAAHRATLAHLLTQRAYFDPGLVPSHVAYGIAEARTAIARLKAALRDAGDVVEDQVDDVAPPDEPAAPALGRLPTIYGDYVVGDKIIGDKVMGDKIIHHYPQPRPPIDPEQAQALLDQLPLDHVPDVAALPPGSRMPLRPNPLFVGREADLLALAPDLKAGRAAVISTGIGGIGKTQLAVEIVHRYSPFFAGGVFWLSFADPASVDGEVERSAAPYRSVCL